MKRNVILVIIAVALIVIGGVVVVLLEIQKRLDIDDFSLDEYQWEIINFSSDINVGKVDNPNTAIEKAKELWIRESSMVGGQSYNPVNVKTIRVAYDAEEACWHIYGTLPPNTLGGVPHAIIRKDGTVIAVWFDE